MTVIVTDPDEALALAAAGSRVVFVVEPGRGAPEWDVQPGRLAVMVGDPADPAVLSAADAMDRELFGR